MLQFIHSFHVALVTLKTSSYLVLLRRFKIWALEFPFANRRLFRYLFPRKNVHVHNPQTEDLRESITGGAVWRPSQKPSATVHDAIPVGGDEPIKPQR